MQGLTPTAWLGTFTLLVMVLVDVPVAYAAAAASAADMSWWSSLLAWLQQVQSDLWRGLAKAIRAAKDEGSLTAASWLIGLSFFYGVAHAAGPGHGKAIISAYLVGNESAVRRGISLSLLSAAAQGVTAIALVSILAALLGLISRDVAGVAGWLETASAWLIVAIGAWLVVQTIKASLARRRTAKVVKAVSPKPPTADGHTHVHPAHGQHAERQPHVHHHGCQHDGHHHGHAHAVVSPDQAKGWREGLAIVVAIGARPCMGAIFVLLFALAQGVFILGVLGTAAMSLGTGITVAALAVIASTARATALKVAGSMDGWLDTVYHALGLAGGLALIILGIALAFQPSSPFPGAG
jgi:ABC-type nickel/cobalt efflux system permease component RcnA